MEYTALYRKLRPQNFNEVVGQEHIIQTLKNQVNNNRVNHSYLFCGTRGTGKTSTAKIFAKLLNCENPKNTIPCNECENCKSFDENRNLNIIEIDAASNNSVDDIRNIIEEIKYPPTNGFYKVYIIDEVHMLSIGAFNALLKTLEEPPSYVIFILATTDPQKIPVTILSRCQRFNFKRISNQEIANHINDYLIKNNIDIEEKALKYVAHLSEGSMRDALSILDQCIAFYFNEKITLEKVIEITNAVDDEAFFILVDALINRDIEACLIVVDEIISQGRDISQFTYDIVSHLRNLLLISISDKSIDIIDLTEEKLIRLKDQSLAVSKENIMKYINTFSEIQPNLRQAFNNRIILETCLLKLCNSFMENDLTDVFNKISYIEEKIEEIKSKPIYFETSHKPDIDTIEDKQEEPIKRELAVSEDFKKVIKNWGSFILNFERYEQEILKKCIPNNLGDNFLYIICKNKINFRICSKSKNKIEEVLRKVFEKEYNVFPIMEEDFSLKKTNIMLEPKTEFSLNKINEHISDSFNFNVDLVYKDSES